MAKPRVTATDRLSNVMEVVGLGRRTGMLSVERTIGVMLEEGEVYFASGNPIYATLGPWRGHDALNALAQWTDCRFGFDPQAPQPIPNIPGVLPAVDHSAPSGYGYNFSPPTNAPPLGSGVYPGQGQTAPESGRPYMPQPSPAPSPAPSAWGSPARGYPSGGLNGNPGGNHSGNFGGNLGPHLGGNLGTSGGGWGTSSGGFGSPAPSSGSSGAAWGTANGANGPLSPTAPGGFGGTSPKTADPNAHEHLRRRPRRAPDVRDLIHVVTTYNLSRAHRTVLLLADGEHSVLDLAQLSGKPVDEVTNLLRELEGRGLVYYYQ